MVGVSTKCPAEVGHTIYGDTTAYEFKLTNGELMRIGTDDPENLASFIQSRISSPANNAAD